MATLIIGGAGFLGGQLARALSAGPSGEEVVVFDREVPAGLAPSATAAQTPVPAGLVPSGAGRAVSMGARVVVGDLFDGDALAEALVGIDKVVQLASVVSADAESAPERAWRVNVEGLRAVLEACARHVPGCPFLFSSSVAVFSAEHAPVGDDTKHRPRSTYGMTKAVGELLVAEATRRGAVDGRSARLPTVIVRPGRPNLAASSFASGLFREPLAGVGTVVPVAPSTRIVVTGHRAAAAGLATLLRLPGDVLGERRGVNLPGLPVTVADMLDALAAAARRHERAIGPVEVRPDPAIEAIVGSWPARWDNRRAEVLGLPAAGNLDEAVDAYLEDFA